MERIDKIKHYLLKDSSKLIEVEKYYMKDKFNIINLEKELINNLDKYLTNFPHKEIELKQELYESCYKLLRYTYEANTTYNIDKRIDLQDKIIS